MDSDQHTKALAGNLGKTAVETITTSTHPGGGDASFAKFIGVLLLLFLQSGAEAFKVLLRKNIPENSLGFKAVVISFLFFSSFSAFLFFFDFDPAIINSSSLILSASIFYALLGMGVLICGISVKSNGNTNTNREGHERGDSVFFGFLLKKGVVIEDIYTIYEPLACLALSALFILIHPLIGLPLLSASLAFTINEWNIVKWLPAKEARLSKKMLEDAKKVKPLYPDKGRHTIE